MKVVCYIQLFIAYLMIVLSIRASHLGYFTSAGWDTGLAIVDLSFAFITYKEIKDGRS